MSVRPTPSSKLVISCTFPRQTAVTNKKKIGKKRTAKFFPRWDSPFRITDTHPEASTYTLDIPSNAYPTYHVAQLKRYVLNDPIFFPNRELSQPGPIVTPSGLEEFFVENIIDSRRCNHGWQFLVRWMGYGPQHDLWIPSGELNDCEALDSWYQNGGDGPEAIVSSA
jgi:hypothetical protein